MRRTRVTFAAAVVAGGAIALAGCSGDGGGGGEGNGGGGEAASLTFRTWDENAAAAYERSFDAFTEQNPEITVEVELVPWADYFTTLRTDVAGGSASDLFWINNSSFGAYASAGNLVDIDALDTTSDLKDGWAPTVVEQFTQDGTLWGVPQTSDGGIALYYNADLLSEAGLTPDDISGLSWQPGGGEDDTLLSTAQQLTLDSAGNSAADDAFDSGDVVQYGYGASQDLQAMLLPFIGSNGGTYQDGETFTFTNPKTEEAIQYLVDLINEHHVAPSAADTNDNGNFTLDAFTQGREALFQSGLYNLGNVADNVDFEWGVVELPAGPAGAVSVTNGVAVVGNANSEHADAVAEVLAWLGSAEGNGFIGEGGSNLPGVVDAQQTYMDYWADKDVDVEPFFTVIEDAPTIPAPIGANFNAAGAAYGPIFAEIFLGQTPVAEGLAEAEEAANTAMTDG